MKHVRNASVLVAALGLVALGNACGSSTEQPGTGAERTAPTGTLAVVEADEAAGKLVVTFTKDGRTITYDMRLGPKMAIPPGSDELSANPELPTHEIDARVLDAKGATFHLQMGGDTFIDGGWLMPHVEDVDVAGRVLDIGLMHDAIASFRQLSVPAGLDELRLTGIQLGLGVETNREKPDMGPAEIPEGTREPEGVLAIGPSSVAKWDFRIRKKTVSLLGIPLANHSAVHLRGWSSTSAIVFNAETCNHGTCATSSAMATHCVMPGFKTDDGTHTRFFYSDGCATPYAWNSGPGTHNCNDDSELQGRAAFRDQSQSTNSGNPCAAAGAHYLAPGCTY